MKNPCRINVSTIGKFSTLLIIVVFSAFAVITANAQDDKKRIAKQRIISTIPKHVPIKVEIINGDMDSPLENAKIKITNTGVKPIYFINLNLDTFEKINGSRLGFPSIKYGNVNLGDFSKSAEANAVERSNSEFLSTGDVFEFTLTLKQVQGFDRMLGMNNYRTPPKLELALSVLSFGDGTGFVTPSGKPYPAPQKQESGNKSTNQSKSFFFDFVSYAKGTKKTTSCSLSPDKFIGLEPNVIENALLVCACGDNDECDYLKPVLANPDTEQGNGCCGYPNSPNNPTRVDWYEYAPSCSTTQGYFCGKFALVDVTCANGGICQKAVISDCEDRPTYCEDKDHDGHFKTSPSCPIGDDCNDDPNNGGAQINPDEEEICDDPNGADENCDNFANCLSQECRDKPKSFCDEECDKDDDGFYDKNNPKCGGNDCVDNPSTNPRASVIHPDSTRESTAAFCTDQTEDDEDCDGDANCDDDGCANFCAPPTPTPTATPTPGGGGDECPCNNCEYGCNPCPCNDCYNGCEQNCGWVTVQGQCYETSVCDEEWSPYWQAWIVTCEYDYWCDPDETIWVCE